MLVLILCLTLAVAPTLANYPICGVDQSAYFTKHSTGGCIQKDEFFRPETSQIGLVNRCERISDELFGKLYALSDEYIVDTIVDGWPMDNSCVHVRGNKIIAVAAWNQSMSGMSPEQILAEKRKVYGNEIVEYAYKSVHDGCAPPEIVQFIAGCMLLGLVVLLGIL